MRVDLNDGTGWVTLDQAKHFSGQTEDLYRTLGGSWVLRTPDLNGVEQYQRITLEEANQWLTRHGHYPSLVTAL